MEKVLFSQTTRTFENLLLQQNGRPLLNTLEFRSCHKVFVASEDPYNPQEYVRYTGCLYICTFVTQFQNNYMEGSGSATVK